MSFKVYRGRQKAWSSLAVPCYPREGHCSGVYAVQEWGTLINQQDLIKDNNVTITFSQPYQSALVCGHLKEEDIKCYSWVQLKFFLRSYFSLNQVCLTVETNIPETIIGCVHPSGGGEAVFSAALIISVSLLQLWLSNGIWMANLFLITTDTHVIWNETLTCWSRPSTLSCWHEVDVYILKA